MAKEFDERYRVRDDDEADADFYNSRFRSIDDRLHKMEARDAEFEGRIAEIVADARDRVDNAVAPLVEQLFGLQEQGFLVLPVRHDPPAAVEFSTGIQNIPTATGAVADYFFPGAWVGLRRTSTIDDWAIAKVSSFDRKLGILSVEVTHVGGTEGPHDDVEIVATAGSTIAELVTLDAAQGRVTEAQGWANKAKDWSEKPDGEDVDGAGTRSAKHHAGIAGAAAGVATGAAGTATSAAGVATNKAGEATEARDKAQDWAEGTEPGGEGTKSAREWAGEAQGHAEAAQTFNPSNYYDKTEIDDALDPIQGAVDALDGYAIGDIVRTYAPRPGYLAANGAAVSASIYADLLAAMTVGQAWPAAPLIGTPTSTPGGATNDMGSVSWRPDGLRLAMAMVSSPYIAVYDWNDGDPIKLAAPVTPPPGTGRSSAWSPNGRYLAVGHETSPFITIYDWQSGSPVKLANPASLPPATVYGLNWSADGRFLACGHTSTPFITIYDWNTGSPVKLANPADLPGAGVSQAAFSPDGTKLALGLTSSPFLVIYSRSGTTFTKLADPSTMPASGVRIVAWSSDGRYLATVGNFGVQVYDWETGSPVAEGLQALPLGIGSLNGCAWLDNWLFVGTNSTSKPILLYSMETGVPALLQETVLGPGGTIYSLAVRPGGDVLAAGLGAAPYLLLYAIEASAATVVLLPTISTEGPATYIKAANS